MSVILTEWYRLVPITVSIRYDTAVTVESSHPHLRAESLMLGNAPRVSAGNTIPEYFMLTQARSVDSQNRSKHPVTAVFREVLPSARVGQRVGWIMLGQKSRMNTTKPESPAVTTTWHASK